MDSTFSIPNSILLLSTGNNSQQKSRGTTQSHATPGTCQTTLSD